MAPTQRIIINIRDTHAERDLEQARQTVAWWLAVLTVLMVLFCGAFPFDFDIHSSNALSEIHRRFGTTFDKWRLPGDLRQNLAFFLPVGFVLGALLWPGRRLPIGRIVLRSALALICAIALTATVEFSQVYLISRDPAFADIVSNTVGAIIGFGMFLLFGEAVMRLLARRVIALRRIRDLRVFAIAAIAWFAIAVFAPILARNISSLRSWDPAFPLLIGNQTDGERHWDGTISSAWLSAAPIDDDDLEALLVSKEPEKLLHGPLVMAYHFTGVGPYTDSTGQTADLAWTPGYDHGAMPGTTQPPDLTGVAAIGSIGVPISQSWWLSTDKSGAARASKRIVKAGAFTLVLDVAALKFDRGDGWPRIFSISGDQYDCNLEVLQDHQDLELRIRSGAGGEGGTDPDIIVPDIFTDAGQHRIVVSYDHGKIRVATDASGELYSTQFSPDAWLVWRLYPRTYWRYRIDSSGELVGAAMYRILAMLPMGLLLGAMLRIVEQRRTPVLSQKIFLAVICIGTLLLETSLHWAAGTTFSWVLPIVSLVAMCLGTAVILGRVPIVQRWV